MSVIRQTAPHPLREKPMPRRNLKKLTQEPTALSRLPPPFLLRPTSQGGASREGTSLLLGHLGEERPCSRARSLEPAKDTESDRRGVLPLCHGAGSYHGDAGFRDLDCIGR